MTPSSPSAGLFGTLGPGAAGAVDFGGPCAQTPGVGMVLDSGVGPSHFRTGTALLLDVFLS